MRFQLAKRLVTIGLIAALALGAGACSGSGAERATSSSPRTTSSTSTSLSGPSSLETIPQPPLSALNQRTRRRLAPNSRRVDLAVPTFSDPTNITNPLFPIGDLRSALLVGKLHGRPWRAETTLLPDTKTVDWNGRPVETLQSQFIAYLDGRIFEVAVDLYAQADDGSVWYFGEDAFTYRRGRVADTEGTWVAGVNGPPAMIMPAHPQVGDVYRTENIPGLVFEEVTVEKVGVTVNGPLGPIPGAMVARELHMDEARLEAKYFAPGYGEFFSGGGRTYEANALAIPADVLSGPTPADLQTMSTDTIGVLDAARSDDWTAASANFGELIQAWNAFRSHGRSPKRLVVLMSDGLDALGRGVGDHNAQAAALGALQVAQTELDLQLRYRPVVEVDASRFDLWTRQLELDASAGSRSAVVGDVAALQWIRDRIALNVADAGLVDDQLRSLDGMAEAGELEAAAVAAVRLRMTMAGLQPVT